MASFTTVETCKGFLAATANTLPRPTVTGSCLGELERIWTPSMWTESVLDDKVSSPMVALTVNFTEAPGASSPSS